MSRILAARVRRIYRVAAAVAVAGLMAQGAAAVAAPAPRTPGQLKVPALPSPWSAAGAALRARHHLPPLARPKTVPGHYAGPVARSVPIRPAQVARPVPRPVWPSGMATVAVPAAAAGRTRHSRLVAAGTAGWAPAGSLPVQVAAAGPTGTAQAQAAAAVSRVRVDVAPHRVAAAAGADGIIFGLFRADAGTVPGRVRVRVSYRGFASAFGAGYGARLALFAMPACALTTPRVRACRGMTPLKFANDWKSRTLTAVLTAAPAGASPAALSGPVFAASSTTSGGTGDFKATSLSPSSLWHVGLQTGGFSWSYPLRVPPPIGGQAPSLALSYDSGATDGETAQANSQPGQLGEGLSLAGAGGFIEQKYVSCGDVITGKIKGTNNTDQSNATGDQCWDGQNGYISFAGHSGQLVQDSSGDWHLSGDGAATVKFVPGSDDCSSHTAYNGSYWEVITPDGTQFWFGLNKLPGWTSSNSQTASVWTMPVFSLSSAGKCFSSTYSNSYATMPWRWNLDLVVDPNGNATSFFYSPQTSYYATDSYYDTSGTAHYGTALAYTSGGTLTDIWYGMQDNSPGHPNSGGNVYAHKAFHVALGYIDRCQSYNDQDSTGKPLSYTALTALYASSSTKSTCDSNHNGTWPDTPWDLSCSSASGCTGSGHVAPAFFDTQMLATVTTQVEQGFNNPENVDTWTLGYDWLTADVNSDLVLAAVYHTGDVGGSITLPAVTPGWTQMNNRVDYGEKDPTGQNFPLMDRYRLTSVISETGAQTDIAYNPASCASSEQTGQTGESSNDWPCFPQWWSAGDFGGSPGVLWFYKYTVASVTVKDPTGGGEPNMVTSYTYCNNKACDNPGRGAAWHYDTNVDLVPAKDKTWSQWRGYQYVHVVTGAQGDTRSETDYTFMRGMSADPVPNGSGGFTYPEVDVTPSDIAGTTQSPAQVTDAEALNGFQLEQVSYDGLNTAAQVSDAVTWPWTHVTASSANQGWGQPLTASVTGTAETDLYSPLSSRAGAGTRQTQSVNTYDTSTGLLLETSDLGDVSQPGQALCTVYQYPSPASAGGLLAYPDEVQSRAGACPSGTPALVSDTSTALQSDAQYSYDGLPFGTAPISGNVTETDVYSSADTTNSSSHWIKQSRDTYDSYGRLASSQDSAGYTTTYSYNASPIWSWDTAGYATTQVTVKTPLTCSSTTSCSVSAATTTDINPEWGAPYDSIDPSGQRTDYARDALGRVTSIWLPGETAATRSSDGEANYAYNYFVTATAPPAVATTRLTGTNYVPVTSVQFFDSLLRPRQTQAPAEGPVGNIEVTDTFYDSRGNLVISDGPYTASATPWTPSSTGPPALWQTAAQSAIADETAAAYDGAGRVTSRNLYHDGALQWGTTWKYDGVDEVTVTPPQGGTITSTFTDGRGRTTEIDQYHSTTSASGPYDATTYSYSYITGGTKRTATDAGGNQWSWTYDLLGRQISATDPDTGSTSQTWNDLGQLTSATDAAGKTISFAYDAGGRKTAEHASSVSGQSSGNQLAAWAYDTATVSNPALPSSTKATGQLATATSYVGGTSGEAYKQQIGSYDFAYRPAQVTWTIPRNSVTGALGGTTTGGTASYQFSYSYNVDGTPNTISYPASGPLSAETVSYAYDNLGYVLGEGSSPTSDYGVQAVYQPDGQPQEIDLGQATSAHWTRMVYSYDAASLRLTEAEVRHQSPTDNSWVTDSDTTYNYDHAGNVLSANDSVTGDNQCYVYDYLARLTAAWSQASACPSSPSTPPGASGIGGPAPYQQTLTYDSGGSAGGSTSGTTGNITDSKLITGTGSSATTTDVSYAGQYPAYGAGQPHAPLGYTTTTNGNAVATSQTWTKPGQLATTAVGGTTTSYNWNGAGMAPGQLAAITTGSTTTSSYRYDASGNLLVRQDGATSRLYLPGAEITASSTAITGTTRYYAQNGMVIAARTSSTAVSWLIPDPHGTATIAVDPSNQAITRRYYTPFGQFRPPVTGSWPGTRRFVGGSYDSTTGLTNLGAREYNPATPTFISPDPLLNPYDPQDLNPYDYAANNPATNSDPSGLSAYLTGGGGATYFDQQAYNAYVRAQGGWGDWFGGVVNAAYHTWKSTLPLAIPVPFVGSAIASMLPDRLPIGNPNKVAYKAGGFEANVCIMICTLGIGAEGDLLRVGTGALDRIAPDAGSAFTQVFRVEGPGNARLGIDAVGNVSIKGKNALFLNFGQEARAQQFLDLRLSQGFEGTQIKTFLVPTSYVNELRAASVPESMARQFPNSPFAVDVNQAPDQFGLRAAQFEDLLAHIIPGSGGYW